MATELPFYGTVDLADGYFEEVAVSDTWFSYSTAQKKAALKKATRDVDKLPLAGRKFDFIQALQFPRVLDYDFKQIIFDVTVAGQIVVPSTVLEAAYLQAKFILDSSDNDVVRAVKNGITSQSIGSTSESYDKSMLPIDFKTGICRESYELLVPYLATGD